jgi:hypothetical protein
MRIICKLATFDVPCLHLSIGKYLLVPEPHKLPLTRYSERMRMMMIFSPALSVESSCTAPQKLNMQIYPSIADRDLSAVAINHISVHVH